ncbi:hypothetical protein C8255_23145 [filamentous cyanobacterium CCP3]|nr:hypothetical protein C8255_23145 [filamentous cyanobacterium CCP3]
MPFALAQAFAGNLRVVAVGSKRAIAQQHAPGYSNLFLSTGHSIRAATKLFTKYAIVAVTYL